MRLHAAFAVGTAAAVATATTVNSGGAHASSGVEHVADDDLAGIMQEIVDAKAAFYNCSIAAALHLHNGTRVAVVAGDADIRAGVPAKVDDKFVWGSVTKSLTGSNILRAQEMGLLNISLPAVHYVNPLLARMAATDPWQNFSSLEELFGPEVTNVTVENLARMMSGVPDYDTAKGEGTHPTDSFRKDCYATPATSYSPAMLLSTPWVALHKLIFPPGNRTSYSSTNFAILGLVLAAVNNVTWDSFDQAAYLPPTVHTDTAFGVTGPPSEYTPVHGYDRTPYNGHDPTALPGTDVSDVACVYAGWTASDYTASVQDAADTNFVIYGPDSPVLSPESQKVMVPPGYYGFATFNLAHYTGVASGPYRVAYGHIGATYGFDSITIFFPAFNMSMAVASNIETIHQAQPADTVCSMYNEVKARLLGEPPLNCTYNGSSYFGSCHCH